MMNNTFTKKRMKQLVGKVIFRNYCFCQASENRELIHLLTLVT